MIWILLVLVFMFSWHLLNAFSVSVPKEKYKTHYGSNVTMECTFPVGEKLDPSALTVYWDKEGKFLVKFVHGKEDLKIQKSNSRLRHLNDQLYKGKSLLHITNVTVKDAGAYRCIIGYGGADYKWITLTVNAITNNDQFPLEDLSSFVKESYPHTITYFYCGGHLLEVFPYVEGKSASLQILPIGVIRASKAKLTPYSKINQRIKMDPVTSEYEITCQSEGYPKAEVIWKSRDQDLSSNATVTYSVGPEKLFNVTSILRINATVNEYFQCLFQEKDTGKNISAQIIIPENFTSSKIDSRTYFGTLGAVVFLGLILMLLSFRKKHVRMIATEKNYLSK